MKAGKTKLKKMRRRDLKKLFEMFGEIPVELDYENSTVFKTIKPEQYKEFKRLPNVYLDADLLQVLQKN